LAEFLVGYYDSLQLVSQTLKGVDDDKGKGKADHETYNGQVVSKQMRVSMKPKARWVAPPQGQVKLNINVRFCHTSTEGKHQSSGTQQAKSYSQHGNQ
jgi:hypothetical protein